MEAEFPNSNDNMRPEALALKRKAEALLRQNKVVRLSDSLIYLFLTHRLGAEEFQVEEALTDGGNDLGVDGVFISIGGEDPHIHVIQSKFHDSPRKAKNAFKASALLKLQKFFTTLKTRDLNLNKIANPLLREKILQIRDLQEREFPKFTVWLISNGAPCNQYEIEQQQIEFRKFDAEVREFHLEQFCDFCIYNKSKRTEHSFFVRSDGVIEYGPSGARGVIGIISAAELFHLMKDVTDDEKIDYGLFDLNIRGFLGSDNQINRKIYQSAVSNQKHQFWCLNNGITMTCSRLKVLKSTDRPKIGAKQLSIVNGAQTCGALFSAIRDYGGDLSRFSDVAVSFRLFETDDVELVDDISVASNHQNRVLPRDLKANDFLQASFAAELRKHGIAYLRKRGQVGSDEACDYELDAMKAGQIILSYFLDCPERAKRDSDQIFDELYEKIFSSIDVNEFLFALNLYREIQRRREFIEDEIRIRGATRVENDFVTYGVFHILFLCKHMIVQDASLKNDATSLISDAITIIARVLRKRGNPAYYLFFRDPKTKNLLINEEIQLDLLDAIGA